MVAHRSRMSAFASPLAVLVEEGSALLKALQNTRRDLQAALLRQPVCKPDHRAGRLSVLIAARLRGSRNCAGGRGLGGRACALTSRPFDCPTCVLIEELAAGVKIRLDRLWALDPALMRESLCQAQHRRARRASVTLRDLGRIRPGWT